MENKLIELQEILFKNINSLDKETENIATEQECYKSRNSSC